MVKKWDLRSSIGCFEENGIFAFSKRPSTQSSPSLFKSGVSTADTKDAGFDFSLQDHLLVREKRRKYESNRYPISVQGRSNKF